MINLGEEFLRLRSELVLEEQRVAVNSLSELALRKRKREELRRRRTSLEREVRILHQRFRRLPAPLDLARIRWAQSVLTCPNGRILIVDIALCRGGRNCPRVSSGLWWDCLPGQVYCTWMYPLEASDARFRNDNIGDCLLPRCTRYCQASGFVGLSSPCELVGHPLPEPLDCTTLDCARGQLHLLKAMAQGITGVGWEASVCGELSDETENNPL